MLHLRLQALQLVKSDLAMCHTLSFLPTTKWTTRQISGFYLRLKMKRPKTSLHVNKMMMKKMTKMMQIVNSGPEVKITHLL